MFVVIGSFHSAKRRGDLGFPAEAQEDRINRQRVCRSMRMSS